MHLGFSRITTPNRTSITSSIFAQCATWQKGWQTERLTRHSGIISSSSAFTINYRHWKQCLGQEWSKPTVLFCSLAILDPRVGHTMDLLSLLVPVVCHSDWLFHGESCPRLDVVRVWPSSPVCTWHCSLHYHYAVARHYLGLVDVESYVTCVFYLQPTVHVYNSVICT